jgi:NAD(P)H-flavin reductase
MTPPNPSAASPASMTRECPPADADSLCPNPAIVLSVRSEAPRVATLSLAFEDQERQSRYQIRPGQFNMIYVPGVGEVPISVSHIPEEGMGIGHTIRFTGRVTDVIGRMGPGAVVGLRGPYGRGWPVEHARGNDVLLVTGGLGLAPMRPVVQALLANRGQYGRVTLLHGARQPVDLLYLSEYLAWERQGIEMMVTVDHADETWRGRVGAVPLLFNSRWIDPARTIVLTCGPEILMRFAVSEALNRRVSDAQIYYSLERNMQCAVGLCGHCQLGPAFLCKDGPVFAHRELARFFRQELF